MKRFSSLAFALLLLAPGLVADARAQAGKGLAAKAGDAQAGDAQALYDEAAQYAQRKFDEFREKQVPYDRALEQKTLAEQKDLALQNAARLVARGPLRGADLYYAGLLYALAGNGEGALDSMRRFLADAEPAAPDLKQRARSVAAQQAAHTGQLEAAEAALAEYARSEPRNVADLHRMNLVVASAYVKKKDYARAAPRAADAYAAALEYALTGAPNPTQRDTTIYGAGAYYVSVLAKAGRRAEAVRVAQEMRARAIALPSAHLYGQATELLLNQGEKFGEPPALAGLEPVASPEIKFAELLGSGPVKLAELRGKVVLLDFWETWCTFCVTTMPRLNALHEKYRDRGLVVIGLNEFQGNVEGRPATRPEELEFLRRFKRKMGVTYDFAVSADAENDKRFGVATLPTAVLVDRRGRVRFITIGASDLEADLMKKMVLKLLDENP